MPGFRARSVAGRVLLLGAMTLGCSTGPGPQAGRNVAAGGGSAGSSQSGGSAGTGGAKSQGGSAGGGGDASGSGGSAGSAGSSVAGNGGSSGAGTSGEPTTEQLLPARIRRLTNEEYAWSVRALLGVEPPMEINFPPDARQDGFTRNDAQRVDSVLAKQLDASAQILAAQARERVAELAPCAEPSGSDACAQSFIAAFGARAFRRPLADDEKSGLLAVYELGASDAAYADGIALVTRAMLQSAGFLYLTELGDGTGTDRLVLTPHELASQLSYLITAQPPTEALLAAAESGALDTAEGRLDAARQLIGSGEAAKATILRHVREWLGIDRILETGKDTTVYPDFTPEVRTSMAGEADAFIASIGFRDGYGTVGELLGADWTMVDPTLAAYYGVTYPGGSGFQRVSLVDTHRRGLLNQGAFLSVYAHASESAPVFRGVAVMERLACNPPESPVNIPNIPPPPQPDTVSTTRERFENLHGSNNPVCTGCHFEIDSVGFTFEAFDGAGRYREQENGKTVNTVTDIPDSLGFEFTGEMLDSSALAGAMAESAVVRTCFARHLFRSVAATSGDPLTPSEDAFIAAWRGDPIAEPGSIVNTILTFVASPLFRYRRAQQ